MCVTLTMNVSILSLRRLSDPDKIMSPSVRIKVAALITLCQGHSKISIFLKFKILNPLYVSDPEFFQDDQSPTADLTC